ncbi:hypothetical protein [Calothrix rhizosoleniae]|uniref:hypothetical protein n=1 Tax=Calothrix rhizosoleniae TaxID=888997 RepID=UPI000B498D25|nr:hypothetical protein [Calothrix rhizosoleniae]
MIEEIIQMLFKQQSKIKNYPKYIERGGEYTFPGPYLHKDARLHSFMLQANYEKLQLLCDKYFNIPTEGKMNYQPILPYVFLVFANVEQVSSTHEQYSQRGWLKEADVAFWILTASVKKVASVPVLNGLAWFMPYIFVDKPFAMVTGREAYGFHKGLGEFIIPDLHSKANLFTIDTTVFESFSPITESSKQRLLEVRQMDSIVNVPHLKRWNNVTEAASQIGRLLAQQQESWIGKILEPATNFLNLLDFTATPLVFLKQFRDISHPDRACYQAITEANITFPKFREGGILKGKYELLLNNFDSHPIAHELGLKVGKQDILEAFWFDFDFIVENGTEVWSF